MCALPSPGSRNGARHIVDTHVLVQCETSLSPPYLPKLHSGAHPLFLTQLVVCIGVGSFDQMSHISYFLLSGFSGL